MYQYMSIPGTVFGVAPNWTQPESPSLGEWFNTICYIFTLDELHAMKKHELLVWATAWISRALIY